MYLLLCLLFEFTSFKYELQKHPPRETERGASKFGPECQSSNISALKKSRVSYHAVQKSK